MIFRRLPQFFAKQRPASPLSNLLSNNEKWAASMKRSDPAFFQKLANQSSPKIMWIGCADSRVSANKVIGMPVGSLFVHRNVANVVAHTDFNCLSSLEYAVDVHAVEHIIVCGHYGCGGVQAALGNVRAGLADNWLRHIRDVRVKHAESLKEIEDARDRFDALCELNVIEQVRNVCATTTVQRAWERNQSLAVHGWIYRLQDGIIRDLGVCMQSESDINYVYRTRKS